MYSHILVPLDGSRAGNVAADHAIAMARQFGAAITFVRVVAPGRLPVMGGGMGFGQSPATSEIVVEQMHAEEAMNVAQARRFLNAKRAAARKFGINAEIEAPVGDAAEHILRLAREKKVDLIVMTTRARRGITRALLGSVADTVIRDSKVPVLVLRRQ